MKLEQAKIIAEKYLNILKPYCQRIQIAGSVRREKPEVKDIEIVAIPQSIGFMEQVNKLQKIKGQATGKYTQRYLPEGIKLDLFMADRDNWGLILAIRTGSADFSHKVLACGWVKKNCHSKNGRLTDKKGREIILREEEHLFDFLNMNFIEPRLRI